MTTRGKQLSSLGVGLGVRVGVGGGGGGLHPGAHLVIILFPPYGAPTVGRIGRQIAMRR